jgi:hypothetical protein
MTRSHARRSPGDHVPTATAAAVTAPMLSLSIVHGVVAAPPSIREVAGQPTIEIDVKSRTMSGVSVSVSVVKTGDLPIVMMGDSVFVVGVTRRRFFRSGGATVTRTEVDASSLLVNPDKRKRKRALSEVLGLLDPDA